MTDEAGAEQDLWRAVYQAQAPQLRDVLARLVGPHIDADDLVQEVFVVALKKRAAFVGPPPRAWLHGVAVKVASAARRRARLRRCLGLETEFELRASDTPATAFEKRETSQLVYSILDRIPEKKRTVFVLYELQGWTGEEIAEVLKCPVKTVWTRLYHARREFQARLERAQLAEGKEASGARR